jgi:hypothetical protein
MQFNHTIFRETIKRISIAAIINVKRESKFNCLFFLFNNRNINVKINRPENVK